MEPLISEQLAASLKFLRSVEAEHRYYLSLLSESDKKVNDLLHFLEFNAANYQERGKITTQLYRCLQECGATRTSWPCGLPS